MRRVEENPSASSTRTTVPPRASTMSRPDDVVGAPVGALDQDVGLDCGDHCVRRVFIEDRHRIDATAARQ